MFIWFLSTPSWAQRISGNIGSIAWWIKWVLQETDGILNWVISEQSRKKYINDTEKYLNKIAIKIIYTCIIYKCVGGASEGQYEIVL